MIYTDEENETFNRFKQAVQESKGKANNSLTYELCAQTDADIKDIVKVTEGIGNKDTYNNINIVYMKRQHRKDIADHYKKLKDNGSFIKEQLRTLRDYSWFFGNTPLELIPDIQNTTHRYVGYGTVNSIDGYEYLDTVKTAMDTILKQYDENNPEKYDIKQLDILMFKYMNDYLYNDEKLFSDDVVERFTSDKKKYNQYMGVVPSNSYEMRTDCTGLNICGCSYPNINLAIKKHGIIDFKIYLKLFAKAHIIEHIMSNEMFTEFRTTSLTDILRKNIRHYNFENSLPKNSEFIYKLATTYELLYKFGIGMSTNRGTSKVSGYNKISTRVRQMYKQFMKCKTVDERKDLRELLLKQLKAISADYCRNGVDFELMEQVIQEQDKEFSSETKSNTKFNKVKGQPSGTKFDISELATADTTEVTTLR